MARDGQSSREMVDVLNAGDVKAVDGQLEEEKVSAAAVVATARPAAGSLIRRSAGLVDDLYTHDFAKGSSATYGLP